MATLFRSRAIAGRAAADSTDQQVRIVRAPAWAALILALILLVGLAVWLFAGHVAITTKGSGVVNNYPANGIVTANASGELIQASPPVGARVRTGQQLAEIRVLGETETVVAVRAPFAGTVVSVGAGPHTTIEFDDYLLTIAPNTDSQVAYLYLPADQGRQVTAGLSVLLSPDAVDPTSEGLLRGQVVAVSPLPVDDSRIRYITGNPQFASSLEAAGPLIEVQVALVPDPSAPSGWAWTRPPGPDARLVSGVPTDGTVILTEVRPYEAFWGSD